jgi:hypothetical protein
MLATTRLVPAVPVPVSVCSGYPGEAGRVAGVAPHGSRHRSGAAWREVASTARIRFATFKAGDDERVADCVGGWVVEIDDPRPLIRTAVGLVIVVDPLEAVACQLATDLPTLLGPARQHPILAVHARERVRGAATAAHQRQD